MTSARTDAGKAEDGDPVTLEIGYLTPSEEFAGFVVSDDPGAGPVVDVVADAEEQGDVEIGGQTWQQVTTGRGETAFVREVDGVTVLSPGRRSDEELRGRRGGRGALLGVIRLVTAPTRFMTILCRTSRRDIASVRRVLTRGGSRDSSVPPVTRVTRTPLEGAPMPPRALCPGGDHRPPATGGSCACGMVTRVVTSRPMPKPARPRRHRSSGPRCATRSRAASTTARGTRSPTTPPTTGRTTCGCPGSCGGGPSGCSRRWLRPVSWSPRTASVLQAA